jgi:hypothetical protein
MPLKEMQDTFGKVAVRDVVCPVCKTGKQLVVPGRLNCDNHSFVYDLEEFCVINEKLVFIDFQNSIMDRSQYKSNHAVNLILRTRAGIKMWFRSVFRGDNRVTTSNIEQLIIFFRFVKVQKY